MQAIAYAPNYDKTAELAEPSEVSTTLPVPAAAAFEMFSDIARIPEWLSVVRSVRILDPESPQPTRASFLAELERATIGYTLQYTFEADALRVRFSSAPEGRIVVAGIAQFTPLGPKSCFMHYAVTVDVPVSGPWLDTCYDGHAASAVVGDFREHVRRYYLG